MHTVTKKELVDRIADRGKFERAVVKQIIQKYLDNMVTELGRGNRLEFRNFGIFECKDRAARMAQNPKTLKRVPVPRTRTVKFKLGRRRWNQDQHRGLFCWPMAGAYASSAAEVAIAR